MRRSTVGFSLSVLPTCLLFLAGCGDTSTGVDAPDPLRNPLEVDAAQSLVLVPYFVTVQPGDSLRLMACWGVFDERSGLPKGQVTPVPEALEPFLTWSSSNPSRASVTETGLVLARVPGYVFSHVSLNPWPDGMKGLPPFSNPYLSPTAPVRLSWDLEGFPVPLTALAPISACGEFSVNGLGWKSDVKENHESDPDDGLRRVHVHDSPLGFNPTGRVTPTRGLARVGTAFISRPPLPR